MYELIPQSWASSLLELLSTGTKQSIFQSTYAAMASLSF